MVAWRQSGGSAALRSGGGGGGQRIGRGTRAGITTAAATTAVLPLRTATVAMKTPAATAMAGAQTTVNNQLKAATPMGTKMVTMTAMTMTMETKATAVAMAAAMTATEA